MFGRRAVTPLLASFEAPCVYYELAALVVQPAHHTHSSPSFSYSSSSQSTYSPDSSSSRYSHSPSLEKAEQDGFTKVLRLTTPAASYGSDSVFTHTRPSPSPYSLSSSSSSSSSPSSNSSSSSTYSSSSNSTILSASVRVDVLENFRFEFSFPTTNSPIATDASNTILLPIQVTSDSSPVTPKAPSSPSSSISALSITEEKVNQRIETSMSLMSLVGFVLLMENEHVLFFRSLTSPDSSSPIMFTTHQRNRLIRLCKTEMLDNYITVFTFQIEPATSFPLLVAPLSPTNRTHQIEKVLDAIAELERLSFSSSEVWPKKEWDRRLRKRYNSQ